MAFNLKSWFVGTKTVTTVDALSEQTREGINKAYIPKFLYKPPYGYPRFANMGYIRYLATTPYVEMCISTIINEIASIEWDIVPCDGMEEQSDDAEIEHIRNFFNNPNTNHESFEQVFVRMPVRDLLEVNSGILNKVYNRKEELVEVVARDGATFTKNPDIHGMYTDRDDIILPSTIIDDSVGQNYLNPWTEITATSARERAAYFQYGWIAGPIPIPFGKKEIIWIEAMKRTDDHYGYSPVQTLEKSLQMLLYMIESDLDYYNENNVPKGIIGLDDSDSEEIQAFKDQWFESQRERDEFGNWKKTMHKVPITNKTPNFTRIEFSASEMQVIEKQKWYTKMVWSQFGVTPTELGYTEDAKGSANQIVQSKVFRKKAINPVLRLLESCYNMQILPEFGYEGSIKTDKGKIIKRPKYMFIFKQFDVEDEKAKAELYKVQLETYRTVNEVRKDEGLEDLEGGDQAPNLISQGNNFDFGDGDGYDRDYNDRADDAENPDEGQEDVEDKSQKKTSSTLKRKESKAQSPSPGNNPLIMDEGEKPAGFSRLEKGIKYALKQNEEALLRLLEHELNNNKIQEIKSNLTDNQESKGLKELLDKIKALLGIGKVKDLTHEIIKNNYMNGWDEAEQKLNINMIPDKNAIDFISSYTFDLIKGMNDDVADRLRQTFQRAIMDGSPLEEVKKQVRKAFDVGENRVEMIARTEVNRAANFGRLQGYQKSGVVGKKVYSAHIDNRTSPLCKRLDGQVRNMDEPFQDPKGEWEGMVPPSHPNCRSSWVFKIDE